MRSNYADRDAKPTLLTAAEAAGTPTRIIIPAAKDQFHVIDWIGWSYAGDPTGGELLVDIGGNRVLQFDITTGGPGLLQFDRALYVEEDNQEVDITLTDGGVAGKLNVRYR